ncbi:DUF4148 domain-containing protein [Aquabacterium sp.]|uniref:DUF4148 domain-containing protein n=1 Tax=Aquabacterium sp. TaxID=1872578 RepID=UPI002CFE4AFC|nr:hypothetical protein [Aquabacterium sp.]HSW03136.1 hypothetical protein [Aquabacterium sp.]
MNARHLIAATLAALSTTAALADDPTLDTIPAGSTVSRSEVIAELRQAIQAHQLLAAGEITSYSVNAPTTVLPRSSVKAEVLAARSRGELQPAGEFELASLQPTRTHARPVTTLAAVR